MRNSPIVLERDFFWVLFSFLGRFSNRPVPHLLSGCYRCLRYRSFVLFLYWRAAPLGFQKSALGRTLRHLLRAPYTIQLGRVALPQRLRIASL